MEKPISHLEMSIVDVNSEYNGVSRFLLMENAGAGLADVIRQYSQGKQYIIICAGVGGNGGDGLVAARHLSGEYRVIVLLIGDPVKLMSRSPPAHRNWSILQTLNLSIEKYVIKDSSEIPEHLFNTSDAVVVDALLGTGISGNLREPINSCVDMINNAKKQGSIVISADVPTGLTRDGQFTDNYVSSDVVVTFHKPKFGLEQLQVKLVVKNIGVPMEADYLAGPGDLIPIPSRSKWGYKGKYGRIVIIAGNNRYSGAPLLTALGALRTGADLVTVIVPESIAPVLRNHIPDLIVQPYPGECFNEEVVPLSLEIAKEATAIVIGPGLGISTKSKNALYYLLDGISSEMRIVLDADGLKLLKDRPFSPNTILTPHAGEFAILTGRSIPTNEKDFLQRTQIVQEIVNEREDFPVFLVKGHWDVVCKKGTKIKINQTGVPEMAKGGTGDVLAGITGLFAAMSSDPFSAAVASSFINGIAGTFAFQSNGYLSATGLAEFIPSAISECRNFINSRESKLSRFPFKLKN